MSDEGVAQVNTLMQAAAIVREWQGKRGEKWAVHLEVLAEKIAQEDAPLPPLNYTGLDRSFDDHVGMGE